MPTDNATPIKLAVFDLGGVMIRLAGRWKVACAAVGIEGNARLDDPATIDAIRPLVDLSERGRITSELFDARVAEIVGITAAQMRDVSTAWLVEPYPGLVELLDDLAEAGLRTACLSNTNEHHWSLMTTPGNAASLPLDRLDWRFASHLLGCRKPEGAIYEHVERDTAVPSAGIAFFDDNADNIEAARARGWAACLIDPTGDPAAQARDFLGELGALPSDARTGA